MRRRTFLAGTASAIAAAPALGRTTPSPQFQVGDTVRITWGQPYMGNDTTVVVEVGRSQRHGVDWYYVVEREPGVSWLAEELEWANPSKMRS